MSNPASSKPAAVQGASREVAVFGSAGDPNSDAVARFLTGLGLVPAVVSPQPHTPGDLSALDALEVLREVEYAVVLQAEHLLEIGFLLGAIGRGRICILDGDLARFKMDDGGLWRLLLAREMKQAGLDVDLNKAI